MRDLPFARDGWKISPDDLNFQNAFSSKISMPVWHCITSQLWSEGAVVKFCYLILLAASHKAKLVLQQGGTLYIPKIQQKGKKKKKPARCSNHWCSFFPMRLCCPPFKLGSKCLESSRKVSMKSDSMEVRQFLALVFIFTFTFYPFYPSTLSPPISTLYLPFKNWKTPYPLGQLL